MRLPGHWTADYVDGVDAQWGHRDTSKRKLTGMEWQPKGQRPCIEGVFQSLVGWMTNETCEMTLGRVLYNIDVGCWCSLVSAVQQGFLELTTDVLNFENGR